MYRSILVFVLATAPACAETSPSSMVPATPPIQRSIGVWSDWEAFTSQTAGATVCTLVSRPFSVVPEVEGTGDLALTVARWPGRQDTVTLTAGSTDISGFRGELRIGSRVFPLDRGSDGASVRNAAAAVEAMRRGLQAVANFEGPQGARVISTYSLRGFRAAYGAVQRTCPER